MLQFPKLGSIVRRKLAEEGELADVEVGIRLVGITRARKWAHQVEKRNQDEKHRINLLRKERTAEDDPELWSDDPPMTEEGNEASQVLSREVLEQCLVEIRGIQTVDNGVVEELGSVPSALVDVLEGYGLVGRVLSLALEVQRPKPTQLLS